jgi:molybdate transport system ATP-binding protein
MSLEVDVRARAGTFRLEVAFSVTGGAVALLGPNGAGKSTLVSTLAGLRRPHAGSVVLDGETLDDSAAGIHAEPERRGVGVVFQDRLLFPHLSALDNVAFPLRAAGARRADARRRAADRLARLAPAVRGAAQPSELSGGEQQRVALARALIIEPRLLLLDEPLASLDVAARAGVRTLLREVLASFDGVCVLVTHDPVEALTIAERVVVLEDGRVTQSGTPAELRRSPRSRYTATLVGTNLFRGRVSPLDAGVGRLVSPDGEVVVPWDGPDPGEAVATLSPTDVALHLSAPEGSPRNVLRGRVEEISMDGDRARVRVDAGPPVVAEITAGSLARLDLRVGDRVWASFKTVEIHVEPL